MIMIWTIILDFHFWASTTMTWCRVLSSLWGKHLKGFVVSNSKSHIHRHKRPTANNPSRSTAPPLSVCITRWQSRRTTQLTTSPTRPIRMVLRNLRGTATLPPKGWIRSF